jgi:methyl-accepting chemotaxis protein
MNILNALDHVTLRKRLVALAAIAILGFSAIGAVQFWSDGTIEKASAEYAEADAAYQKLRELQQSFLGLRVQEQKLRAERRAENLPIVAQTEATVREQAAGLQQIRGLEEIVAPLTTDMDRYLDGLAAYSETLETLGYRDRLSVNRIEEGKDGIDSPTGYTVDLSNAVAKLATRISEELEFDDQPAVFYVSAAFEGIRRDILMLTSEAENSYVGLIEQKSADMRDILGDEDLDPDFSETANALLDELHRHLGNLATAEIALAAASVSVNEAYEAGRQRLESDLKAIAAWQTDLRNARDNQRAFLSALIFSLVVCTLVIVILASVLIVRTVSANLSAITDVTTELAGGKVDCHIPYTSLKTEIGALARALVVFQENARERGRLETEARAENAAKAEHQEQIEATITEFKQDIVGLISSAGQTISAARSTAHDLREVNDENDRQAFGATEVSAQASANVETVAAATQQLNNSIREISAQISATTGKVQKVSDNAAAANADVEQLAQAATKIDEIIVLIQAIAEQTNLLALNATIEAARAGEHGKGFSIVASEVKSLATQTATATEEISSQIKAIQRSSGSTVSAVAGITDIIRDVQESTVAIAGAIEEQTAATSDISVNVQEAAERTRDVAETVSGLQQTAAGAKQSADEIGNASEEIGRINEQVRSSIDDFLARVAAA